MCLSLERERPAPMHFASERALRTRKACVYPRERGARARTCFLSGVRFDGRPRLAFRWFKIGRGKDTEKLVDARVCLLLRSTSSVNFFSLTLDGRASLDARESLDWMDG